VNSRKTEVRFTISKSTVNLAKGSITYGRSELLYVWNCLILMIINPKMEGTEDMRFLLFLMLY
jgi:hypothetical protein